VALLTWKIFESLRSSRWLLLYAFTTSSDDDDDYDADGQEGSDSGGNSGSQDDSNREGYWTIRNQWGYNWFMSGYAYYVAVGENMCGVLFNDLTQAYF
jgi:hypothetical protein